MEEAQVIIDSSDLSVTGLSSKAELFQLAQGEADFVFADDKVKSLKVYLVVLRSVLPYWL
jgi:hypothetical protein